MSCSPPILAVQSRKPAMPWRTPSWTTSPPCWQGSVRPTAAIRRSTTRPATNASRSEEEIMRTLRFPKVLIRLAASLACVSAFAMAYAQQPPAVDVVIGSNFGHLPVFVGVEKGFFKKHGVDVRLKVVNTGTDMVNAMQKREVQIGDMSVTTFLKARHSGDPFRVIAIIMNDATRANADEPLAIVARKDSGIRAGTVDDLKGKRIGVAQAQTSDEYLKMVLARRGMKYEDVTIVNIMAP